MARAFSIVLALLATAPAVAEAEACMCVLAQPTWDHPTWAQLGPQPAERTLEQRARELLGAPSFGPESVELGPFFSSDGRALVSDVELEAPRRELPRDLLWCASLDDPRCGGGQAPPERSTDFFDASRVAAGHAPRGPTVERDAHGSRVDPSVTGGPRAGVRDRLDRPPRS